MARKKKTEKGLYLRGTTWWMRFTVNGQRYFRSTGTDDYDEALAALSKMRTMIFAGKWYPEKALTSTVTFGELAERYIERYEKKRDKTSLNRLLPFFKDMMAFETRAEQVHDYIKEREEDGASNSTIYKEFALGRRIFNIAISKWQDDFGITRNPFKECGFEQEDNRRFRWLTVEEEKRLLAVASPEYLYDFIIIAIHTGCRLGEMLTTNWKENIDLKNKIIKMPSSKDGNYKEIPMSKQLYGILLKRHKVSKGKGLVLPINPNTLREAWVRCVTKSEVADIKIHDLRHTFGTRQVMMGTDIYRLKFLMGHKTLKMTERYAHHDAHSLKQAGTAMDNFYTKFSKQKDTKKIQSGNDKTKSDSSLYN